MNLKVNLFRDSMIYGKKRRRTTRSIFATVVSIVLALVAALLVATALGFNPIDVVAKLFYIGFNDPITLLSNIGAYCFAAFAFAFASKAGLFNIGISGQMLAAGTVVIFFTTKIPGMEAIPNGVGQILTLLVAMITGSLIATLVGALDVYLRVNSVVSSILLNWIIYFLSFFLLATYARAGSVSEPLTNSVFIPDNFRLWDTQMGTGGIIPICIMTVIVGLFLLVIFKYTVFGHKIRAVGLSPDGSKYAGYNVKMIKLSSFAISGAISGILAVVLYTTTSNPAVGLNINLDSVPIEGFNGIAISLIAQNNPIAIVLVSALFGLFQTSIPGIVIPSSYINVLLGVLMVGAAMSVIIYKWKPWRYLKTFKYNKEFYKASDSFENRFDALISKYKSIYIFEKRNIYKQEGHLDLKDLVWEQTLIYILDDYNFERNQLMYSWNQTQYNLLKKKPAYHDAASKQAIEYNTALIQLERIIQQDLLENKIWNENKLTSEFYTKYMDQITILEDKEEILLRYKNQQEQDLLKKQEVVQEQKRTEIIVKPKMSVEESYQYYKLIMKMRKTLYKVKDPKQREYIIRQVSKSSFKKADVRKVQVREVGQQKIKLISHDTKPQVDNSTLDKKGGK